MRRSSQVSSDFVLKWNNTYSTIYKAAVDFSSSSILYKTLSEVQCGSKGLVNVNVIFGELLNEIGKDSHKALIFSVSAHCNYACTKPDKQCQ